MRIVLIMSVYLLMGFYSNSQTIQYKYDKTGRLIQAIYPNQMAIDYSYDKDGNRISQITSTVVVTAVNNLADSAFLIKQGVFIYPNPNNGNFHGKIYSSKKQEVTISIYTVEGKLIHTYKVTALRGFYDFNINISPKPTGTYLINVDGQTIHASKKIVITN